MKLTPGKINTFMMFKLPSAFFTGVRLKSISPEKAESLVNKKLANIYLVTKVKIVFKEIDNSNPPFPTVFYTYHYESPIIEAYEDVALTQKIGEISLKNLTYKEK